MLRPNKPQLESRTCTDCSLDKTRAKFVPVAGTRTCMALPHLSSATRARATVGQMHRSVRPNARERGSSELDLRQSSSGREQLDLWPWRALRPTWADLAAGFED
jgi:hypothetical protein